MDACLLVLGMRARRLHRVWITSGGWWLPKVQIRTCSKKKQAVCKKKFFEIVFDNSQSSSPAKRSPECQISHAHDPLDCIALLTCVHCGCSQAAQRSSFPSPLSLPALVSFWPESTHGCHMGSSVSSCSSPPLSPLPTHLNARHSHQMV